MTTSLGTLFPDNAVQALGGTRHDDGRIELPSAPRSDLFFDPKSGHREASATELVGRVEEQEFQLSARVTPELATTFDAGVLVVRVDEDHWGKLCLEQSPAGAPTAVSVVTRGTSDDANGWVLPGPDAWLRISREGEVFAFHVSNDGVTWDLLRIFHLPAPGAVDVALVAQSPTGEGCAVSFSDVSFVQSALADPRSGV